MFKQVSKWVSCALIINYAVAIYSGIKCHLINLIYNLLNHGKGKSLSRVQLFVTPQTVVYQASPSMGFSRQEYWSGLPLPSLFLPLVKKKTRITTIFFFQAMQRCLLLCMGFLNYFCNISIHRQKKNCLAYWNLQTWSLHREGKIIPIAHLTRRPVHLPTS